MRKAELEQARLDAMLRDKEARGSLFEQRRKRTSAPHGQDVPEPDEKPESVLLPHASSASNTGAPFQPVGSLTVHVLCAKDLPAQSYFTATNAYAKIRVGFQRFYSPALPGCSPVWGSSFTFDVHRVDTALRVEVYREGLGWGLLEDELVGSTEIPFLDLEEWSGCRIGRVLENEDPQTVDGGSCATLELKASLHWF